MSEVEGLALGDHRDGRHGIQNEATADCLAGAFAQRSARGGNLEKGDLEEAFFGLAGDPASQFTGYQ